MMREYDVEVCSGECGRTVLRELWVTLYESGGGVAFGSTYYCPYCGTRVGIDADGRPWRERMVPRAALEWLAERATDVDLVGSAYAQYDGINEDSAIFIDAALLKAAEEGSQ